MLDQKILQTAIKEADLSYKISNIRNCELEVEANINLINGIYYVSFPGTKTLKDWLQNIKLWHQIYPYEKKTDTRVRLHSGCCDSFFAIRNQLHSWLRDTDKPIICTGHSLGGCLASIAAVDLQYNYNLNCQVITFNSPSCGNKYWSLSANRRVPHHHYRVRGDIVPYILPKPFYYPVGNRIINVPWSSPYVHGMGNFKQRDRTSISKFTIINE